MTRGQFGWDYPPGVTGNEPEIAGYPEEEEPDEDDLLRVRYGDPDWEDPDADLRPTKAEADREENETFSDEDEGYDPPDDLDEEDDKDEDDDEDWSDDDWEDEDDEED